MGEVVDLVVETLKGIRKDLHSLKDDVRNELRALRTETREGFAAVNARLLRVEAEQAKTNARLDHLVEFSGDRWRDLDRRVTALERDREPRPGPAQG
jgi:hypothetical protein